MEELRCVFTDCAKVCKCLQLTWFNVQHHRKCVWCIL